MDLQTLNLNSYENMRERPCIWIIRTHIEIKLYIWILKIHIQIDQKNENDVKKRTESWYEIKLRNDEMWVILPTLFYDAWCNIDAPQFVRCLNHNFKAWIQRVRHVLFTSWLIGIFYDLSLNRIAKRWESRSNWKGWECHSSS